MTIPLTTNPGGVFRRLGKLGAVLDFINTHRGSDLDTKLKAVHDEFLASNQDVVDLLYTQRDSYRSVTNALPRYLRDAAVATVIGMAWDDAKVEKTLPAALTELIRQMTASGDSVEKPVCSASVAAASANVGNGTVAASVIGPDGKQLDYVFAETIEMRVTADSYTGGTTADEETVTVIGDNKVTDTLSKDWPAGSGASGTQAVANSSVDGDEDANVLVNSDFEAFTSNTPDNWTVLVGSAGSSILAGGSSDAYKGSNCLRFVGDGSELTAVAQTFNSGGGTSVALKPKTVYAFCVFVKVSATPSAGVLGFSLVNGSNSVINDDASTANTVSKDLTGVSTSYVAVTGFFRTPSNLPSTVKLRAALTTALDNAKSVYVDEAVLVEATQLYPGGPFANVFAGSTKFVKDDRFTVTVANNYGSAWQKLLHRLFDMPALGLQIPSVTATSETVADSLIA